MSNQPPLANPLTRRTFVSGSAAIALSTGSPRVLAALAHPKPQDGSEKLPGESPAGAEEPLLRFIQINDLHVQSEDPALPKVKVFTYKSANEKARWIIEAINQEQFCPLPDFVLGLGDMIHGENLERLGPDLKLFQEMIKPLGCPFYPLVGNHEVIQMEHSAQHLKAYTEAFGKDRVNYTFTRNGILFIALNNSGGHDPANGKLRREWLGQVLKANPNQPKILLCHIPLLPVREQPVLAQSFGFSSYIDLDTGMLPMIEEHADSIIAVLSGHLHLTGVKTQKGILHLSLSGTASYPSDGAVVYEIYADRMEVMVKQIPRELAQAAPTLHGKPRHDNDFTDTDHPTAQEYQCGRADERYFTVALTGAKRPSLAGLALGV